MNLGSTAISTLKLGSSAVSKVMLGASQVWSSGPVPTLYVDSVNGLDTNDGLTAGTALKTLTAAQSALSAEDVLGLAKGSYFTQALSLTSLADITIVAYGSGSAPKIDGAGPVTETWTQDDAITYPNVWNITVTHGWPAGGGRMIVWKNGAMMKRVASVALVNAEAGTYYSPGDNVWSAATYKLYIYATEDPNTDGNAYERTKLRDVITGAYNAGLRSYALGIVTGRQGANDGSIVLGKDCMIERVLAFDGHKHNALQESGTCKNSCFINAQPEAGYLHVFYTINASGLAASFENCSFVGQTNGLRGASALYCHDNSGAAHATISVTGCVFANTNETLASSAVSISAVGNYVENCGSAFSSISGTSSEITHLLVNKQYLKNSFSAAGAHAVRQSAFYLLNNTTLMQASLTNWGDILLENSTVHIGDWDTTIANYVRYIINRTTGTGTFSANHNIFLMDDTDTTVAPVLNLTTAAIGTINNNVYFYRGSYSKSSLKWAVDGVNKTWAQWQELGHDTNSLLLDATDITFENLMNGHPSTGDFRLKAGVVLTLPDGTPVSTLGVQEHYDYQARTVKSGAPSVWPTIPKTYADGESYIGNPTGWDFYP